MTNTMFVCVCACEAHAERHLRFSLYLWIFLSRNKRTKERFPRVDARLTVFNPPSHLYGFMKK